jgi:hypothetical protein
MSNLFKTAIEAVFDAAWLTSVNDGVTVVNGSNSASGIVQYMNDIEVDSMRLSEGRTGFVKVKADDIGTITADAEVTVAGKRIFVTKVETDPSGALTRIDFHESQPVPESYQ